MLKAIIRRISKDQRGFSLIEVLVAVGIIAAITAAVIPFVSKFAGTGDEAAKSLEIDSIQAAIDALMSDEKVTVVVGTLDTDPPTNDFSAAMPDLVGSVDLDTYIRDEVTAYYYCWDNTGAVTVQQDEEFVPVALCPTP